MNARLSGVARDPRRVSHNGALGARRRVALLALVLGIAAVGVSLALDRVVQFDPQGWLLWGREVTGSGMSFSTASYPSWKPLPFLFAVPLSVAGAAAPPLWLAIERSAALAGIALAYALARDAAGWTAGAIAAAVIVISPHWITLALDGRSEPLTLALVLGAAFAHRQSRRRVALVLLALAALDRPEALGLAGLYALLFFRRSGRDVLFAAAVLAVVPVLWLGGDWLGSGDAFHGAKLARASGRRLATAAAIAAPLWAWLRGTGAPIAAGAAAGVVVAMIRRDRFVLSLGAFVAAWLAADVVLTLRGYPGAQLPRFVIPAVGLGAVLGAIGIARTVAGVRSQTLRRAAGLAAAAWIGLFAWHGVGTVSAGVRSAAWYARNVGALDDALADAGGGRRLLGCGHLAVDNWARSHVAWDLGISPSRIGAPRPNGVIMARVGLPYPRLAKLMRDVRKLHLRRLATLGPWRLLYAGSPARTCALFRRS